MKKLVISHLLINLYLLVWILPAIPVLDYLINYDYIVEALCENRDKPILTCNGKCYLGDQVERQLDLEPESQKPLPPQIEFFKFISPEPKLLPRDEMLDFLAETNYQNTNSLEDNLYARSLLRPPQAEAL